MQLSLALLATLLVTTPTVPPRGSSALDHDWESVRLAVTTFANAVASSDSVAMGSILHPDFRNRARFLAGTAGRTPGSFTVLLRYASYERLDDSVRVAPVILLRNGGVARNAQALILTQQDTTWFVRAIRQLPASELPAEVQSPLPEHFELHPVSVSVRDELTGAPLTTRVHIRDGDGAYWPPDGRMRNIPVQWRIDLGGDVVVGGRTYAYVDPDFVVSVPEGGPYELEVIHGMEYEPKTVTFEVVGGKAAPVRVGLRRWIDLSSEGWYSGDTHVHFLDPRTALQELAGEDLNVVNVLATKWGELITNVEHFIGKPSPLSTADGVVYVGEETRHDFLGHTILLNIKELVYPLTWGGPGEGVEGGFDWPPMAHQADQAHEQGGFVSWAHFPGPRGEVAVDVALGKLDAVDLLTWGDAFRTNGQAPPARTWYRFLNVGFDVPATAGTDKMSTNQVVGSVRTYVHLDQPFTYERWIEGAKAGRTFVTTGPMLTFSVDGREAGETIALGETGTVTVHATVRSLLPVERLEVVRGGEVVMVQENPDSLRNLTLETPIDVEGSTWIAVRTASSRPMPTNGVPLQAHSSPVYVSVAGAPRQSPEDAAFLMGWTDEAIEWAETQARFHRESQREAMVELFRRARAIYAAQVGGAERP